MNKTIISATLVAILLAVTLLSGCSSVGRGKVVTVKKDFANFTRVTIEDAFEFEIVQSGSFTTTIAANEDLLAYITISQEGEMLRIYLNPRQPFTNFTLPIGMLKVKITMPALDGLNLSGATKGSVTGFKSSQDFTLEVSGASALKMEKMEIGNIKFNISGASKVSGKIKTGEARLVVSGASRVELVGLASNLALTASGASNLDLTDFEVNSASINLSGASEVTVSVKEKLEPVLTDASRLYFYGNPNISNLNLSGASTIKHK